MPGTSSDEHSACLRMDDRGYGAVKVKTVLPYDRAHPKTCRICEEKIEGGVKQVKQQEDVKFFSANKSYRLVEYLLHILDGHNYP